MTVLASSPASSREKPAPPRAGPPCRPPFSQGHAEPPIAALAPSQAPHERPQAAPRPPTWTSQRLQDRRADSQRRPLVRASQLGVPRHAPPSRRTPTPTSYR
jgi:hypothetical protein